MASLLQGAQKTLGVLRAINDEMKKAGRGTAPGAGVGVDRGTQVALGGMAADLKFVRKALSPTAAEKRSVL